MPKRIQLSRKKGWRMPANARKVDRSTPYGNPFPASEFGPDWAVELYRAACTITESETFDRLGVAMGSRTRIRFRAEVWRQLLKVRTKSRTMPEAIGKLKGLDLACWCGPGCKCHADVLLELANALATSGPSQSPTPGS